MIALFRSRVPESSEAWSVRRTSLLGGLRNQVFRWFPEEPISFATRRVENRGAYASVLANFQEYLFETEPGVPVRALLFQPHIPATAGRLLIVVRRSRDNVYFPDTDELLPLLSSMHVIVLTPRFADRILPAGEFTQLERTAAMIGRTVAALQVWDVRRAINWATAEVGLHPIDVSVYGRGSAGIVALYASLFEERVDHVILRDPPVSHWDRPALLTVLRATDIPEVVGALAPRRLTVLREIPAPFTLTRQIYQVCGADAALRCAASLPDALLGVDEPLGRSHRTNERSVYANRS
jgi:hypothetical protein